MISCIREAALYSLMINSKQQAHSSAAAIASKNSSCTNPGLIIRPAIRLPTQPIALQKAMKAVLTAKAVADITARLIVSERSRQHVG